MTYHSDGCDGAEVEVQLHMTESGGIGNVIPRGSNDQRKRGIASLFKLWNRSKHAGPKESFTLPVNRSSSSAKYHKRSPSPSYTDSWPEKHTLLPPFSPTLPAANIDCNPTKGCASTSGSHAPLAFPLPPELEGTRLRSHKSLGSMANRSAKSLYNPKLNSSTKYLHSSATTTPPSSPPRGRSKEQANRIEFSQRISSEKTVFPVRRDDPRVLHDTVSLSSHSKVLKNIPPVGKSKERYPNLVIEAVKPNYDKSTSAKGSCSLRGASFEFVEAPTPKKSAVPVKAFVSQEVNRTFPGLVQHDNIRPPFIRNEASIPAKKKSRSPQGTEIRERFLISKKSRSEGCTSPIGPRDFAPDDSKFRIPPQRHTSVTPCTPSDPTLTPSDTPSTNYHHLYPKTRHSSKMHFGHGNGQAEMNGLFEDTLPQPPRAEDLGPFTSLLEVGQTGSQGTRGQEEAVVDYSSKNYITNASNGVISSTGENSFDDPLLLQSMSSSVHPPDSLVPAKSNHSDANPTLLPFMQLTPEEEFTASTFDTELDDEIEDVEVVVGSRLVSADPPLKAIIQDLQFPQSFPRQNTNNAQRKSPNNNVNRHGLVFDSCLCDSALMC